MSRGRTPSPADDLRYMTRALELARQGLGRTHPNPSVGAVLVKNGRIVGEGFTAPAGGPHAEVRALRAAGARARGADLFVTLEPCAHVGRTPPCVDSLLPLDLRRVVVATVDPNPRVRGRSIRRLRTAGVTVVVGTGADEANAIMAGYRSHVLRGRPLVTLKLAATLDGRIAARTGDARWITGPAARRRAHELRNVHDAILVGAGTVRADDPELTCRIPRGRNPIRVVASGPALDLPPRAKILDVTAAPTWIVVPVGADPEKVRRLRARGVEVVAVPGKRGSISAAGLMKTLAARGVTSLLVEGGAMLAADLLALGLVDCVAWFVAPTILGGDGVPAVSSLGIDRVATAVRLGDVVVERVDPDVLILGSVLGSVRPAKGGPPFASSWPPR
jgi:diaminohydroxyphosphoribosylaminopyrimidine deaminase / 5-amino-6-(5-phosphoribosylamino)uracil reductase